MPVLVALAACGQSNAGESAKPTTSNCSATACTVSYPAKARNNQASAGGPGISVLGVDTQLVELGQGAALMRIGSTSANIEQGKSATLAGLTATVTSLTSTEAVVAYKKA
jgi:hypothetical protein